ncbi:MAG: hypothetical protein WC004_03265 [Candidatus Absconditabacterales bacterium]
MLNPVPAVKKWLLEKGCVCPYAYAMQIKNRISHCLHGDLAVFADAPQAAEFLKGKHNLIYYPPIDAVVGQYPEQIPELQEQVCMYGAQVLCDILIQSHKKVGKNMLSGSVLAGDKTRIKSESAMIQELYSHFRGGYSMIKFTNLESAHFFATYMGPIYHSKTVPGLDPSHDTHHLRYAPAHMIVLVPLSHFNGLTKENLNHMERIMSERHKEAGLKRHRDWSPKFFIDPKESAMLIE